jgi:hypothetical protein
MIRFLSYDCPSSEALKQLEFRTGKEVIREVVERFVNGYPRTWWTSLKQPFEVFPQPDDQASNVCVTTFLLDKSGVG